jgi:uncharacterized protein YbbC (DUF1343 family)
MDFRNITPPLKVDLQYLLMFYSKFADKEKFFTSYFDKLAGTPQLKEQIKAGLNEEQIRESWKPGLAEFNAKRKKYLLYE